MLKLNNRGGCNARLPIDTISINSPNKKKVVLKVLCGSQEHKSPKILAKEGACKPNEL